MIPVIDFARAEAMQRATESQRQAHRDSLKVAELRDQILKRLIRTGRAYQEAIDSTPEELLAELGLRAGADNEPPLVEIAPQQPPFTPAIDFAAASIAQAPTVLAVEPEPTPKKAVPWPKPAPRSVAHHPSENSRPARPNASGIRVLADQVLEILKSARCGSTSSVELDALYEQTRKSKGAIDASLEDLSDRGLIRKVRPAEKGHLTVILKDGVPA